MAAVTANPAVTNENKSSKRKKPKSTDATAKADADRSPLAEIPSNANTSNGVDAANGEAGESAYVKELMKNIRNLRKRLANTAKVDSIIAANPGRSLDQLLADKKINQDQKQQAENKPLVESQIKSTEERLTHYKKFEDDLTRRFTTDRDTAEKAHESELEKAKEEAYAKAKAEAKEEQRNSLLMLSRFLRAAAASRQNEEKQPETEAFEGLLLLVYGGDLRAVDSIESFVNGDEAIISKIDGAPSGFSFKQVRDKSNEQLPPAEVSGEAEPVETGAAPESDPTVANASLTEIQQADAQTTPIAAELDGQVAGTGAVPEAATIDAGAANAVAAAATTDATNHEMASSISKDWTEVPRDPAETDTGLDATPAAPVNNALTESVPVAAPENSWAEDVPAEAPANDGFSEVPSKHRGRGGFRGTRGSGEHRGRGGFRGRGRGRGDGEYRGRGGRGRGGNRGRGGAEGGQS